MFIINNRLCVLQETTALMPAALERPQRWFKKLCVTMNLFLSRGESFCFIVQSAACDTSILPVCMWSFGLQGCGVAQCFSAAGPWHQLYRAARESSGIDN